MSFQAMSWAVKQKTPDPHSKLLLLMLANHSGRHETDHDICWPSMRLLSEECCMSEDTIARRVEVLQGRGLLHVTPRTTPDGKTTSNLYRLPVPDEYYGVAPAASGGGTRPERGCPPPPAGQTYNMNLPLEGVPDSPRGFRKPTLVEFVDYGKTLEPPMPVDESFSAYNHYQSNGWKVGKNPMKDWKAAVRTCHGRWIQESSGTKSMSGVDRMNHSKELDRVLARIELLRNRNRGTNVPWPESDKEEMKKLKSRRSILMGMLGLEY